MYKATSTKHQLFCWCSFLFGGISLTFFPVNMLGRKKLVNQLWFRLQHAATWKNTNILTLPDAEEAFPELHWLLCVFHSEDWTETWFKTNKGDVSTFQFNLINSFLVDCGAGSVLFTVLDPPCDPEKIVRARCSSASPCTLLQLLNTWPISGRVAAGGPGCSSVSRPPRRPPRETSSFTNNHK